VSLDLETRDRYRLQVANMVGVGLERSDLLGIVFGVLELNTK